jgi:hypothetical protein
VSPIPLGVDMHTADDRNWVAGTKQSACHQQAELDAVAVAAPPLRKRRLAVLVGFFCNNTFPERIRACDEMARGCERWRGTACTPPSHFTTAGRKTRTEAWQAMAKHAFVACPAGRGIDSHRLWEALLLGTIPIVRRSSLDRLLVDLPVLVVDSWAEATNTTLLAHTLTRVSARFGANLLESARVRRQLSTTHWAERIRAVHAAALRSNGNALDR